jgi:hypothetical protein
MIAMMRKGTPGIDVEWSEAERAYQAMASGGE